jgi:hypothetical protein
MPLAGQIFLCVCVGGGDHYSEDSEKQMLEEQRQEQEEPEPQLLPT